MIRVVLVDDHAVVRSGLTQLLDGVDDIEVVGAASEGATAVELVRRTSPDVVLMDLQMPGVDGVAATRAIAAEHHEAQVLVLTSYSDVESKSSPPSTRVPWATSSRTPSRRR